jgi:hypothetical protein
MPGNGEGMPVLQFKIASIVSRLLENGVHGVLLRDLSRSEHHSNFIWQSSPTSFDPPAFNVKQGRPWLPEFGCDSRAAPL